MTGTTPAPDLTWDQVLGWRVAQHRLADPAGGAVDVTARLAGVQAQVAASAGQVIAIRAGAPDVDLDRLLWTDRSLVKTWAMRGTLHLLPASEWSMWVAVLRTREWRITPGWERYHGVTAAELDAVTGAIPEALAGGPLTRDELADRVAAITGHAHLGDQLRSGWAAVFKPAANRGLLCQGPPRGTSITFTDPARWLGEAVVDGPHVDGHAAMATVLARFLDAYGPATREDLARWLGVTPEGGAARSRRPRGRDRGGERRGRAWSTAASPGRGRPWRRAVPRPWPSRASARCRRGAGGGPGARGARYGPALGEDVRVALA